LQRPALGHGRDQAGQPVIGAEELIELDLDDRLARAAQRVNRARISSGNKASTTRCEGVYARDLVRGYDQPFDIVGRDLGAFR